MNSYLLRTTFFIFLILPFPFSGFTQASSRQDEVARRGADVMPISHKATLHVFAKSEDGGTLRLIVRDPSNTPRIQMVRAHLREMRDRFEKGDYSGPAHIHGDAMPGLAELKAARPGQIAISYRDVADGAQLVFRTGDSKLIMAMHSWIDAQLSDHGADAKAGR